MLDFPGVDTGPQLLRHNHLHVGFVKCFGPTVVIGSGPTLFPGQRFY
jgi:hypothetical protein